MRNIERENVLINTSGSDLHSEVVIGLRRVSRIHADSCGLSGFDLSQVTTRTNYTVAFSKFVELRTLNLTGRVFDREYVEALFATYHESLFHAVGARDRLPTLFRKLFGTDSEPGFESLPTYARAMHCPMGMLLVHLHSAGAITLPAGFTWPKKVEAVSRRRIEVGRLVASPLLAFVRLLDSQSDNLPHAAFESIGISRKRREWFLTYGTKLLLATGWNKPSDASLDDIVAIKNDEHKLGSEKGVQYPFKPLIEVLSKRFGDDFKIQPSDWDSVLSEIASPLARYKKSFQKKLPPHLITGDQPQTFADAKTFPDAALLHDFLTTSPQFFRPGVLKEQSSLVGVTTPIQELAATWIGLQEVYLRKVKRENQRGVLQSLGTLNGYLFQYLPQWFQQNADTSLEYPDEPSKLIGSIFVSRLMQVGHATPRTLVEALDSLAKYKGTQNNSQYALLKNIEVFFRFLEDRQNDLPGCTGFRQPLSEYDYPQTSRGTTTKKRPIPRKLFSAFLDVTESLLAYSNVLTERILDGRINANDLEAFARKKYVLDAIQLADNIGFVPMIFHSGKAIPLRVLPHVFDLDWFKVRGGKRLKLPQPHALNQILTALHTGIRHNHIQWLDLRSFDCRASLDDVEFSVLHVNTDKAKTHAWEPHVNMRVIEVLRGQAKWRDLIDEPGFGALHFYNDNEDTKWAKILPLFSASASGLPHPDSRYDNTWRGILYLVQGLLPELGVSRRVELCTLAPPCAADAASREEYGRNQAKYCKLDIKTDITPHSARVTVVSQYATILPLELVGRFITGQTPAVAYRYVKLEADQLAEEQTHQAMAIRERAYRSEAEAFLTAGSSSALVRADDVNSNFSRSLRQNLPETLTSYGCVSITMNEGETSGLDILRATRGADAAENKTEICPYGNHCPPEVVKQWKGFRRCGLCQYAVRSVDHLPAVSANVKKFSELLGAVTVKLSKAQTSSTQSYSEAELNRLEEERYLIAEELVGWQLNEEVLYSMKCQIAAGQDERLWVVQKPEVIIQDLKRVEAPSNMTAYTLSRLQECVAFPGLESPTIAAKFDIQRRMLLANTGDFPKAFDNEMPSDAAAEYAGLLRSIVSANGFNVSQLMEMLNGDSHLRSLASPAPQLMLQEVGE